MARAEAFIIRNKPREDVSLRQVGTLFPIVQTLVFFRWYEGPYPGPGIPNKKHHQTIFGKKPNKEKED